MKTLQEWLDREPAGPKPRKGLKRHINLVAKMETNLAHNSSLPRATKRLATVGAKAKREAPKYASVTTKYLLEHPRCEIGPVIKAAGFEVLCLDTSTHVHHTRGRGRYKCDPTTFKASCSGECHPHFVHISNVAAATALGLLLTR